MKKGIYVLFIVLISQSLFAQNIDPSWQIALKEDIKWLEVNDWGMILACTSEKLYCLNPEDGAVLWEVGGLSNMKREGYSVIPGTPLIQLQDGPLLKIINSASGDLLVDSEAAGYTKVKDAYFLSAANGVLVSFKNKEEDGFALFDIQTGAKQWEKLFSGSKFKGDIQPDPLVSEKGAITIAGGKKLITIDGISGETLWKYEGSKPYIDLFLTPDQGKVIAVQGTASNAFLREKDDSGPMVTTQGNTGKFIIEAFDVESGEVAWSHEYKSKYGGVAIGADNFILVHAFSINFIDFETGKMKWKKEPKYVGGGMLLDAIVDEEGILYAVESHVTEGKIIIYYLDHDGEKIWKRPPYTNPTLLDLQKLDQGVLFISPKGANIADIETGKEWWSGVQYLSSGGTPIFLATDEKNHPVLWRNGQLIRILPNEGKWELLAPNANLKTGFPMSFTHGDDGYLITSGQEALLIGDDGQVKYHAAYQPPAQSLGKQILLSAASVAVYAVGATTVGSLGMAYSMAGELDNNQNYRDKGSLYMDLFVLGADISGSIADAASRRFSTQLEAPDYKLILTSKNKQIGLVKVDLQNGEETGFIFTDDRTPEYVLDMVDHVLYFKSGSQRISAYKMK